jgi:ribosomal protein L24
MQSVVGQVSSPTFSRTPYVISADGRPLVLPSVGGITYNVRVGDPAIGWSADHVEPGASIINTEKSIGSWSPNSGLNTLVCAGNEVKVVSGDAKGAKGVVIGKHGGVEHVIVDFPPTTLDKMVVGDKMQVKAYGTGMILTNYYPEIHAMNISPDLLSKIPLKEVKGTLEFPVTHIVPAAIMGSGLGSSHSYSGDYDIQMFDKKIVKKHGLGTLRFGDFVAITDADHSYGRIYRTGAVSTGIVVHSDCVIAGHGPGVMTVLTSSKGKIKPVINKKSNLRNYLKLK